MAHAYTSTPTLSRVRREGVSDVKCDLLVSVGDYPIARARRRFCLACLAANSLEYCGTEEDSQCYHTHGHLIYSPSGQAGIAGVGAYTQNVFSAHMYINTNSPPPPPPPPIKLLNESDHGVYMSNHLLTGIKTSKITSSTRGAVFNATSMTGRSTCIMHIYGTVSSIE